MKPQPSITLTESPPLISPTTTGPLTQPGANEKETGIRQERRGEGSKRRRFTAREVSLHNHAGDAWVILHGAVYNVTDFLPNHPGGPDIILDHAGGDVTELFHSSALHQHSDHAFDALRPLRIGSLGSPSPSPSSSSSSSSLPSALSSSPSPLLSPSSPSSDHLDDSEDIFDSDKELEDVIDLDKPIITQMWSKNLSLDVYVKLAHTPRFTKDGEPARFFENDLLEYLSRNSWKSVLIWIPVSVLLFFLGLQSLPLLQTFSCFFAGIMIWSLLEYILHRYLFHMDGLLPDNRVFICAHFLLHGVHHFLPMDKSNLLPFLCSTLPLIFILLIIYFISFW